MIGTDSETAVHRRVSASLALALLPLLSGCVGVVAIPLVAGGALSVVTRHRVRAATPVKPSVPPAQAEAIRRKEAEAGVLEIGKVVPTTLKELPPPTPEAAADKPTGAASADEWQPFFAYALAHGGPAGNPKAPRKSALLVPNSPLTDARVRDCQAPTPAVVIDLDDGPAAFEPSRLGAAPSGVAEGLARLRQAGVVVLWISQLPAARAQDVATALRVSGLDPQGQDQLLLERNAGDRKQLLREDAAKDVCIVAIAGDRRGDFDELFDYLRNPDSAFGLDTMIGNGWFLVPRLEPPAGGAG